MAGLLILRPEPGASATAAKARELGVEAICRPLFTIEPVAWAAPDPHGFDGLLLTSANAVRSAGDQLLRYRGLEVFAVGETTALAAREAGFDIGSTGEAGVERLLASVDPQLSLLHLCGEHRKEVQDARQKITSVAVYCSRAVDVPDLSDVANSVALVHSQRAARRFAELVHERSSISVAAISSAAAEPLGRGWRQVLIADQPRDEALLALAAMLCKNAQQE